MRRGTLSSTPMFPKWNRSAAATGYLDIGSVKTIGDICTMSAGIDASTTPAESVRWFTAVVVSFAFVVGAVVLEVIGGLHANSAVPDWAELVPIAWPTPARVLWWLTVATAAGIFRLGLHRLGFRQRPFVVVASVGPFVVFAIGIASGSSWSTWH